MLIQKSDNGGKTWTKVHHTEIGSDYVQSRGIENTNLMDIVVDPANPDLIYFLYADIGLFKSSDGGKSFRQVDKKLDPSSKAIFANKNDTRIIIDPQKPNILYTSGYPYMNNTFGSASFAKSIDYGETWAIIGDETNGFPASGVNDIVIDPTTPIESRTIYISNTGSFGIYKSVNGGRTWSPMNKGLGYDLSTLSLAIDPLHPQTLYAGTANSFYKTTNGALTWIKMDGNLLANVRDIAINYKNSDIIYVAASQRYAPNQLNSNLRNGGIFKSSNGGKTWANVLKGNQFWALAMNPLDPNILYTGNLDAPYYDDYANCGMYKTKDGGNTWNLIDNNLPNRSGLLSITIAPSDPRIIYIGLGGSGGFRGVAYPVEIDYKMGQGWNLISIPCQPPDVKLEKVLQSIAGNYQSVWMYDGVDYRRYATDVPAGFNNLSTIEPGKGYWVYMLNDSILTVSGNQIKDMTIPLRAGWNLVGYNCLVTNPIGKAISLIASSLTLVLGYDGEWSSYMSGLESYAADAPINDLEVMEPGKGYWIYAKEACMWNILP